MPTSLLRGTGFNLSAALLIALSLSGCNRAERNPDASSAECQRFGGKVGGLSYCEVSMYRLVVNPDDYYGRPIRTVGYLLNEGTANYAIAPTRDALDATDYLSCFRVPVAESRIAPIEGMQVFEKGIYSVEISGSIQKHQSDWCMGQISGAIFTKVQLIERLE